MQPADFLANGFCRFGTDAALLNWVTSIRPIGEALADDADLRERWLRSGGTWFAGVNILPNTSTGELGQSGSLRGDAVSFLRELYPTQHLHWDQAQISVCYPRYPMPDDSESEAAFAFRVNRNGAHMDGLHPIGPDKRRFWRELHGFVLGIPLTQADAQAAPLVVWRGSHIVLQQMLRSALDGHPLESWSEIDLTETYKAARRRIFEDCERVELSVRPGEASLLHRFSLHGVAAWQEGAVAEATGRMIAYFRPSFDWNACEALNAK